MSESRVARALARCGRFLRPLFNPDAASERERLETVLREQREATAALQKRGSAQAERLSEVMREIEQLRKHQSGMRNRLTRELQFSERVLKRISDRAPEFHVEKVLDRLARMGQAQQPVLVGPWAGEVGFELIYWVPFVRWALGHAAIDPARVTVFSRGGARPWYDGLAANYIDVLDYTTPDEFRERTAISRKQRGLTAFDRDLLRRASRAGAGSPLLLHPAMMYVLFMPFWRRDASIQRVHEYSRYRRYERLPVDDLGLKLPERYVAVRFYFSDCFPDTPGNRRFVAQTLKGLAERSDVVVLHAGIGLDDHADAVPAGDRRIHVVDAGATPRENLAVQTAVISRAQSFVGTYGGFSYLAPLYGVDTLAFYSERNFQVSHLHAADHASQAVGGGRLTLLDVADAALVDAAVRYAGDRPEVAGA
jgi:hypothetical protein